MPTQETITTRTPREVAEQVRRMVEGASGSTFVDMFAADGVLEYPFAMPGMPERLEGRDAIREFYAAAAATRGRLEIDEVTMELHETTDPEVVVVEIEHRGTSHATNGPYRVTAVGVMRVRDGEIVSYRDYMDPLTLARVTGRTEALVAALQG
ncbi:MAG: nuclear transport factor 2 family protein [Streptosporangiales bacterium]|nr:nuclear transport factor 2 family protein [Streptosporangiales bacterium]